MRRALLVLCFLAGTAHAGAHASKAGKVQITLPEKWAYTESDELVRASSPDNSVAFVFWIVDSADVKTALSTLEKELYSSVQGLRWIDKLKKLKINAIPATFVEGIGVNAQAVQLDLLVTVAGPTKTKKGVIMMAVVENEKLKANQPAIQSIFQTLKSTK
jgi:hypothetical protein